MVMVRMDKLRHHTVVGGPTRRMILPVLEERVVDLRGGNLQLLLFTLALQQAVQLGQAAQRQSMRDGSLRVLGKPLGLVDIVVAVTGDEEAGEKGAQDESHKHTRY